jgi:hypothetical protein
MRSIARWISLIAAGVALTWSGGTTAVFAADEERVAPGDRLERLERRVNEMAQRQEQLMRRLEAQTERQGPAVAPGREGIRPQAPMNDMAQRQGPMMRPLEAQAGGQGPAAGPVRERLRARAATPGMGNLPQPQPTPVAPVLQAAPGPAGHNAGKAIADMLGLCFLVACIFNILIAIWISTDIRRRGEGSGLFIVLALLAGIPTGIIYAIVRIGDRKI